MQKRQKINWDKNLKAKIWFYKKNIKFLAFLSFRFCPIPTIENWEISESFLLLQISTVIVTQVAKATKNKLGQKLKGQDILLEEK